MSSFGFCWRILLLKKKEEINRVRPGKKKYGLK